MGLGVFFQKRLNKEVRFQTILKKHFHFQTVFEKIPHPGGRARVDRGQGPGPRPQPGGVSFQTQFENGPFFQNSLKTYSLFQTFLKNVPRPIFKNVTESFFKSFTFS